jgi:hypothetical protein
MTDESSSQTQTNNKAGARRLLVARVSTSVSMFMVKRPMNVNQTSVWIGHLHTAPSLYDQNQRRNKTYNRLFLYLFDTAIARLSIRDDGPDPVRRRTADEAERSRPGLSREGRRQSQIQQSRLPRLRSEIASKAAYRPFNKKKLDAIFLTYPISSLATNLPIFVSKMHLYHCYTISEPTQSWCPFIRASHLFYKSNFLYTVTKLIVTTYSAW